MHYNNILKYHRRFIRKLYLLIQLFGIGRGLSLKRTASGIMLTMLITSTLALAFNIQPVEAAGGTIYIRADGSVDPPTAPIQRDGDTYTLTSNISEAVVVERNSIVVDGADYTLQGLWNGTGIDLSHRMNVTVRNIKITSFQTGMLLSDSSGNTLSGNTVTDSSVYGINLVTSSRNTLQQNTLTNNYLGVRLDRSSFDRLCDNTITDNYQGINLDSSSGNTLSGNTVARNQRNPILIDESSDNTLSGNTVTNNYYDGIWIWGSSGNELYNNTITTNYGHGIILQGSYRIRLHNNYVANNYQYGIHLCGTVYSGSTDNAIFENTLSDNGGGIVIYDSSELAIYPSSGNLIYHNNFISNSVQASDEYQNTWDDGYPSGGNHWSDYTGVDELSGPYQNETGSDGIGDTPYNIDSKNRDRFPLMNPWTPPPTPDFSIVASPTSLTIQQGNSDTSVITITSINEFNLPVQLTVYGAPSGVTTTLNPEQITPPPNGSITSWLTISVATTATPRSYNLTVTGTNGTMTHNVNISLKITAQPKENQPPVADAGLDQTVFSGDSVQFDGSNSNDSDGTIVSYRWSFGDGMTAEGKTVSHRFRGAQNEPKTYTVTLTVEDNNGATATDTASVTVNPLKKLVDVSPGYFGVSCWMKATYNWVGTDEATGENLYIISKIETYSGGISGAYQLFILRRTSPPPSIPKLVWYIPLPTAPILRTYVTPFDPSIWQKLWGKPAEIATLTFQEGTFQGIGVTDTSLMVIVATGTETGITLYYDAGLTKFEQGSPIVHLKPEELKELWELRDIIDLLDKIIGIIGSPCELRIYDSDGYVTGLVNGETKEEIPGSVYVNDTILILYANDTYRYDVVGIEEGTYKLLIICVEDVDATTFTATEIPTSLNALHQYAVNWSALSRGEEGVTIKVDSNGDGVFELTFASDSELTRDEFMQHFPPAEAIPMWIIGASVAAIAIGTVAVAVFWRKRKQHVVKG
jgi:parallel beta-helix repeat protein